MKSKVKCDWCGKEFERKQAEIKEHNYSFRGSATPITGGTICQMAMELSWEPRGNMVMEWNDEIQYDGDDFTQYTAPPEWNPVSDFRTYLETLFEPEDLVGYVTGDVWQDADKKWFPSKGVYMPLPSLQKSLPERPRQMASLLWGRAADGN